MFTWEYNESLGVDERETCNSVCVFIFLLLLNHVNTVLIKKLNLKDFFKGKKHYFCDLKASEIAEDIFE